MAVVREFAPRPARLDLPPVDSRREVRYTVLDGHLCLGTLSHRHNTRRAGTSGALPAARQAGRRLRVAGAERLHGRVGA